MGVSWGGSNNSFPAGAILHEPDLCAIAGVQKLISAAPATSGEAPTPTPDFLIEILHQSCASISNMMFPVWFGCKSAVLQVNDGMLPNWTTSASITSIPVPHQYIYLNVARMLWVLSVVSHISWDALITCETASEFPSKSMMQVPKTSTSAFAHCPNPLVGWVQWNFRPPLISGLFQLSQVPNTLSHKFGLVELAVTVSDQYIRSCLGPPWI